MTPLASKLIDQWRAQYNPLRGLTLRRAVDLLEGGERGEYPDLQWTYRTVEKRDGILRACKRKTATALVELDWEIKIPETVPTQHKQMADKQYKILREAYDRIENLREAFKQLAGADFRGYCHLEKIYANERLSGTGPWLVERLEVVPQWHWVRDGLYGDWKFIEDARQTSAKAEGQAINRDHFIIREVEDPINEIALIAFIRKNFAQKDWDAFVESYGIPWFLLELPNEVRPGTPEADSYLEFVQKALGDARGAVPNGSKPHNLQVDSKNHPFADYLKRQDNEIVLAATSSLLTVTTESGSGTLAGNAHQETFEAVARAQALLISEILNEQFDRPLLNTLYPGEPVYAYFELAAEDGEDVKDVVENVSKLKTAGYAIDLDDLEERTGYKLAKEDFIITTESSPAGAGTPDAPSSADDDVRKSGGAYTLKNRNLVRRLWDRMFNRQQPIEEVSAASLDEAMRLEYAGLYQRIDDISQLPADQRPEALRQFRNELPEQLAGILESDASIDAIETLIAEALIDGAIESAKFGRERPITERKLS